MNSYWAGYSGAALVLTKEEFSRFLKRYVEATGYHQEDLEKILEDGRCNDTIWLRSAAKRGLTRPRKNNYFTICEISTDNCDGMALYPFRQEGKANTYQNFERKVLCHTFCDDVYAIFSDKSLDGPDCFEEKPYPSYEAFVQEFKDKLKIYLPEDFDWDDHIGNFSYACYA